LRDSAGSRRARRITVRRSSTRLHIERFEDRVTPSAGSLDATFGTNGKVTTDFTRVIPASGFTVHGVDTAQGVAVDNDGRIVVAGTTSVDGSIDFALARYDTNGNLDASFGNGGLVRTDFFGGQDFATGVVIQADGKIVVGGYANVGGSDEVALVRYNADGTLDSNFGTGGLGHAAPPRRPLSA